MELCINQTWSTICDEYWDNEDASVVCHQLGYSRYGKLHLLLLRKFHRVTISHHIAGAISSRNIFRETIWPLTVTSISCTGDEDSILKCDFDTQPNSLCHHTRDASVICQCKIVIKAESKWLALSGDTDISKM